MYSWPPNLRFTVIINTWLNLSNTLLIILIGVWAIMAPYGLPRISFNLANNPLSMGILLDIGYHQNRVSIGAFRCFYMSPSIGSQSYWLTISFVSKATLQYFLHAFFISGPKVRFGSKLPSITLIWIRSTPASSRSLSHWPISAQSAGRTDGMIWIGLCVVAISSDKTGEIL